MLYICKTKVRFFLKQNLFVFFKQSLFLVILKFKQKFVPNNDLIHEELKFYK